MIPPSSLGSEQLQNGVVLAAWGMSSAGQGQLDDVGGRTFPHHPAPGTRRLPYATGVTDPMDSG